MYNIPRNRGQRDLGAKQKKDGMLIEKYVCTFVKRFNKYPELADLYHDLGDLHPHLITEGQKKKTKTLLNYYKRKLEKADSENNTNSFASNVAQGHVAKAFAEHVAKNGITPDLKKGITYRLKLDNNDIAFYTLDKTARMKMKEAMQDMSIVTAISILKANAKRANFHSKIIDKGEEILDEALTLNTLNELRKLL